MRIIEGAMFNRVPQQYSSPAMPFAPDFGAHQHLWLDLVNEISRGGRSLKLLVARNLGQAMVAQSREPQVSALRYAFALSLLADLLSAGADCFVADSTIF